MPNSDADEYGYREEVDRQSAPVDLGKFAASLDVMNFFSFLFTTPLIF